MEDVDASDPWFVDELDSTAVWVEDLAVGDCFFDGPYEGDGDIGSSWEVDVVDCADRHPLEVVGEFELTGDRLPRQNESFFLDLEDRCWSAFDDNVAPDAAPADLWITFYWPSRQSWDEGDRLVTCVAATDRLRRGSLVGGSRPT
nr:septum formation family protein [Nocardioides zeae]